jgi:mannose-1-phosphate guanylyltransferase
MRAMIMAAGIGTRLRPVTDLMPKPMVPIVNRPALHHILRLLAKHGFAEVVINLHHLPDAITDYFGDGASIGMQLSYSYETELLGTAGGVKNNAAFLGGGTFLVMSGDAVTDIDLPALLASHRRHGSIATMAVKQVSDPSLYGVVVTDTAGRVTGFQEKPRREDALSDLCNCGIYVFEPEILSLIPEGRFDDFGRRLFPDLLREQVPFHAYALSEYWNDVGNLTEYLRSNGDALAGRVAVEIPGNETAPNIWVEEGAEIHPSARLQPPLSLGQGCSIGRDAVIEGPAVVGAGSVIGEEAHLARVAVLPGSQVAPREMLVEGVVARRPDGARSR